jgi:hypothetical protein
MLSFCDGTHRFDSYENIPGPGQALGVEELRVGVLEWPEGK